LNENVPMPKGYEYLLPLILKPNVVERSNESTVNIFNTAKRLKFHTIITKEENKAGVPQGGILSPVLMNWTLDGLLHTIRRAAESTKSEHYSYYYDPEKLDYLLKQDKAKLQRCEIKNLATEATYRIKARVDLVNSAWMVRYADDFIVGIRSEQGLINAKTEIIKFLAARGLSLSEDKTKTMKWKANAKIDFLSWTNHLLFPTKINWIIKANRRIAGKLRDWIGTYTYPSKKAVLALKSKIKDITSINNTWESPDSIIKKLRYLILG